MAIVSLADNSLTINISMCINIGFPYDYTHYITLCFAIIFILIEIILGLIIERLYFKETKTATYQINNEENVRVRTWSGIKMKSLITFIPFLHII